MWNFEQSTQKDISPDEHHENQTKFLTDVHQQLPPRNNIIYSSRLSLLPAITYYIQGEDRKKWPPMKIGFLDYNCVKRAENVEKFINRTVQLPNMTEGLTLLNLKCNFHHTNR